MPPAADARAFVPGHVTGFFSVHRREDPIATGSRGAGLTLDDGVTVSVRLDAPSDVRLGEGSVPMAPVDGVLEALGVDAAVRAETPLPTGAGFGVSGGLALGTALAVNAAGELGRSENALVRIAHRAEVEAGTGLGDVVAQARGGAPIREEPGAPPHGSLDGIPGAARIEYVSFGELDTASVIGGETALLSSAGESALAQLRDRPTLPTLFAAARSFAREAELLVPPVETAIEDVTAAGGEACMAMLGETVVALGTGLSDAGYDPQVTRIHPAGAALRMD